MRPPRLALAGFVAAAIAFLFVAFGSDPAGGPAKAALTFPLPEKPGLASEPPGDGGLSSGADAIFSPELAEMIAYAHERTLLQEAAVDVHAILATIGAVDGLGHFARAAELVGLEHLLQPGESYTIFVPNDDAFAELAPSEIDGLLGPAGHERLLTLLSHHVLPTYLTSESLAGDRKIYTSLAGLTVTIETASTSGTSTTPGSIRIGDAGMVEADLPAEDSVIHIIDQVLPVADLQE